MNSGVLLTNKKGLFAVKAIRMLPVLATLVGLSLAVSSQFASAQQYKKITRLGTTQAVCAGGIETAAQLQAFFASNPNAVRDILADSGWSGSADDLLKAVANGDMIERDYPVGTKLLWTGVNKNGNFQANKYREWAGAKAFEAFQVNLSSGCRDYHIAIPKACCNVSLISVEESQATECKAPPVAAAAPAGTAPVTPAAVAPVAAERGPIGGAGDALKWIPYLGLFAGSETRARFEPSWNMDMVDSSEIAGFRLGLMKEISSKTAVFGQVSYYDRGSINDGNIYPEDGVGFDIGLDRKLSERAFIGGGIGAWNVENSDFTDASIFGHVGGDIGQSDFQWFLEGRLFDSDSETHDSFSDNKMFSAGVRYLVR